MSEAVEAISDAADVEGLACVAIRLALTPLIYADIMYSLCVGGDNPSHVP